MSPTPGIIFSYDSGLATLAQAGNKEFEVANTMDIFLQKISEKVTGILIIGKNWNIYPPTWIDLETLQVFALSEVLKPSWIPEKQFHTFETNTFLTIIRGIVDPVQISDTKA